jgi:hypothetical protein
MNLDMSEEERTPAEQRVIDKVAEEKGEEWAEEHAGLIIAQAKKIGDI